MFHRINFKLHRFLPEDMKMCMYVVLDFDSLLFEKDSSELDKVMVLAD